ncbi:MULTISPECIES: hypothetical protein [Aerococcus]|uniref:Uncharacterized protein n=1 Tax=Aerococcus sanguinicola TaxID=119206 RepID=A0A5N1GJ16_9LACT|nr:MULTISPECIES: hypothetical protein [Aerococcus]KAA9300762.1 hypothetical protein F6I03_05505 [Aerococcus sanguinicola]MDK6369453.1 hypothetical protein [Aerococcus sp. UMB9870]MDK6680516.1 hypothetical protein [Aerococcus sp. UMB8608]MDK6686684.1 hypothetical protein [Aerococcus sp. UMB8623]MDK6940463.1 hypothetical protein [Aerococcus sp. UMB8487]
MTLIEIGSLAGALLTLVTLIRHLVKLITAIHDLIQRIDRIQTSLDSQVEACQALTQAVGRQGYQLKIHQDTLQQFKERLKSLEVHVCS